MQGRNESAATTHSKNNFIDHSDVGIQNNKAGLLQAQ